MAALMTQHGVVRRLKTDVSSVPVPPSNTVLPTYRSLLSDATKAVSSARGPNADPYALFFAPLEEEAPAAAPKTGRAIRGGAVLPPLDMRGIGSKEGAAAGGRETARARAERVRELVTAAPSFLRHVAHEFGQRASGPDSVLGEVPFTLVARDVLLTPEATCKDAYKYIKQLKGRATVAGIIEVVHELLIANEVGPYIATKCFAHFAGKGAQAIDKSAVDELRRGITLPRGVTFEMVMAVDRAIRTRPREEGDRRKFISEGEFCRLLTDDEDAVAPQLVAAFIPVIFHLLVTKFKPV